VGAELKTYSVAMKLQLKGARVASRTCFAALLPHVSDAQLDSLSASAGVALEVTWMSGELQAADSAQQQQQPRSVLVTWAGGSSARNDTLELSHSLCDAIGLRDGAELTVTLRRNVPTVSRMFVEPLSPDDWEVIQLHAGLLEDQVLNQVRAVSEGMTLPLWISDSSMVKSRHCP
jgi:peroxin-1